MEKTLEALKILESTLEKYRMNKTKVSQEDLNGKYRVAFQKLRRRLKAETEAYLTAYCLSGFPVCRDDSETLCEAVRQDFRVSGTARRAAGAVFQNFSIPELQQIAEEQRQHVQKLYDRYLTGHICLYVAGTCWDERHPCVPLIYNDITDRFYDELSGRWVSRDRPAGEAILIFVRGEKEDEQTGKHKEI